jgi:hypothetical protein
MMQRMTASFLTCPLVNYQSVVGAMGKYGIEWRSTCGVVVCTIANHVRAVGFRPGSRHGL